MKPTTGSIRAISVSRESSAPVSIVYGLGGLSCRHFVKALFLGGAAGCPVFLHAVARGPARAGGHAAALARLPPCGLPFAIGSPDLGPAGLLGGGNGSSSRCRQLATPATARPLR